MAATLPTAQDCCDSCIGEETVILATTGWFYVADLTALRALASSVSNVRASVGTLAGGFVGEYYWDAISVDADDSFAIIASGDGGVGRWKKLT